jgi:hypothetical protein
MSASAYSLVTARFSLEAYSSSTLCAVSRV